MKQKSKKGCVNFMYKIAVIGDKDSIYGFAALGLKIFPCDDAKAALNKVKELVKENYGIIYMTEAVYSALGEELDEYRDLLTPAIIPIPGVSGNTGIGMRDVSRSVEKAVGSDIIQ